jgi:hypothetical protein
LNRNADVKADLADAEDVLTAVQTSAQDARYAARKAAKNRRRRGY